MCGLLRGALLELWEDNALPPPWILAIPADQPLPCCPVTMPAALTHTHAHRYWRAVSHPPTPNHKFSLTRHKHTNSGERRHQLVVRQRLTKGLSQGMHGHTYCLACICVCAHVCVIYSELSLDSSTYLFLQHWLFGRQEVQQRPPRENKRTLHTILLFQEPPGQTRPRRSGRCEQEGFMLWRRLWGAEVFRWFDLGKGSNITL